MLPAEKRKILQDFYNNIVRIPHRVGMLEGEQVVTHT